MNSKMLGIVVIPFPEKAHSLENHSHVRPVTNPNLMMILPFFSKTCNTPYFLLIHYFNGYYEFKSMQVSHVFVFIFNGLAICYKVKSGSYSVL